MTGSDGDFLKKYRKSLSKREFVIVSNREPYVHERSGPDIRVDQPAGGLTAAMDDVMKSLGGLWVAWGSGKADRETVDAANVVQVPPDDPSYRLKRVWLRPAEVENYYHGFSNSVLWPLCHFALDKLKYQKRYWHDYHKVNRRFAEAVLEEVSDDAFVWIHDYHLCLLPQMIKSANPRLFLAHFWHIPWPSYSVFRTCPQMEDVMKGMLANDLIGFQIDTFVKSFMECAREALGAKVDYELGTVNYRGHVTWLKAFPISIDFEKFEAMAQEPATLSLMREFPRKLKLTSRFVGIGVDRLEYTKGLFKRLEALDLFFQKNRKMRGEFTYIQVAVPTRTHEPYTSYKRSLEAYIDRINGKFATTEWKPIVYIDRKVDHDTLTAYYRLSDLAIISSIYDGMNLVAKEYIASQVDEKGVLLLSEFCGASEELDGAFLLNPYDIEGFAEAIKKGLLMSAEEKASRMKSLRAQVRADDIRAWIRSIIDAMMEISRMREERISYFFDHLESIPHDDAFLFLDYDGTLTPIVSTPGEAVLSSRIREVLEQLRLHVPVAIISGRTLEDVRQRVSMQGLLYAGNHGAEIWDGEGIVFGGTNETALLRKVHGKLRKELAPFSGVIVEDKRYSLSIHYRLVPAENKGQFHRAFWNIMERYDNDFRITSGKKVLEVRPKGIWNKGDVVRWLARKFGKGKTPIYIGDDITDVDAFRAVRDFGVAVSVGANPEADYYLRDQNEVEDFLNFFLMAHTSG